MNKLKVSFIALILLITGSSKADEGMWLLQLMKEQHSIDMMKNRGLKLDVSDLYNPGGISLKDAVGIFGRGCTGEIISPEGLILTNHHCGYSFIQQHSSVEHDYLTNGFWAYSRNEELPTPELKFTFIERIEDVTDIVNNKINNNEITVTESFTNAFLNNLAKELFEKSDLYGMKGVSPQLLPFYAGNKFYLMYRKVYSDVRMVAAPPSSVGKFGGEKDNWMWPRHTGDFSIFRIYADADGEPADYSPENTPLKSKKYLTISIKGINESDYAMIMGFPGRTNRHLTTSEIVERMEAINDPRIEIRTARLNVLREVMHSSDKIRIQYANKYAGSSNYLKNSIGMNKAIINNDVLGTKEAQETAFREFARKENNHEYTDVVNEINETVVLTKPIRYQATTLNEAFLTAIEFGTPSSLFEKLLEATEKKNTADADSLRKKLTEQFGRLHNKDYDHEVDKKVASVIFPLYAKMIEPTDRPDIYNIIEKDYKGNYEKFIDDMYENSIMANRANFDKFLNNPTRKAFENDPELTYYASAVNKYRELQSELEPLNEKLGLLHKTYIRGLGEMKLPTPSYPDANFTLRLTYGNIKSYNPRDGIHYKYYTTTKGILEKEDPENREFNVPAKLKELILNGDYGKYALPNGDMPVCFLSTNDITGGNSGSPVLNAKGELIGCAFDGNWESLSGDINFDDDLQRCINLDIRYVLFILDKLGNCGHLINEMTIVE